MNLYNITKNNEAIIQIKIPIETDEYLREFIFKNINMRRKIWNDFVEEANKYVGEYHMYDEFISLRFLTEYKKMEMESIRMFSKEREEKRRSVC